MTTTQTRYEDDKFEHLSSDIDKMRVRYRQYISFSNAAGALSVVDEILFNSLDECKNPRSPGNKVHIEFDERDGFITVGDNGRGIPLNILEDVYTSLNMGSNLFDTKNDLKMESLGQNGTGTLAICALAEHVEITSYRGGTENKYKMIVFEEGKKVDEKEGKCSEDKHGMLIKYKPSKVMGNDTYIIWNDVHNKLLNLQYLNSNKIAIDSVYTDKDGKRTAEKYKAAPFQDILNRNNKDQMLSPIYAFTIADDNVDEDLNGKHVSRFMAMDIAFAYTSSLTPYIDSFSNSNNTVDNGDHLDGAIEAICRYFQTATKNSMSDKEKEKLDIKWDDVKSGMSIAVSLKTNFERLYTNQSKHKIISPEFRKVVVQHTLDMLGEYFGKNASRQKAVIDIVKMNARARREGDKVRTAVVKTQLTNWSSYKMRNFDPCTAKGKEYSELFICEGSSARGSLKQARDPRFQALFEIKGVSANVFKMSLDQIVGQNGNKEFTDLVTILGCNVGTKFDLSKLTYDKIIIATDADVDGYWIRSLLLAFFFKVLPDVVRDGRIYIAEPPLYRVNDKKNPFVINMNDYLNRYISMVSKEYKLGYRKKRKDIDVEWLDKSSWGEFLDDTKTYLESVQALVDHYKVNDRLLEMVLEEFVLIGFTESKTLTENISSINIQHLMNRIGTEFKELYFDDKDKIIRGPIDTKWQELEVSEILLKKSINLIKILGKWMAPENGCMVLHNMKNHNEQNVSLLGALKLLQIYKPNIEHRFKGLITRPKLHYLN